MNNQDRCDGCSAQALVRVMFVTGDLLFCGHHFARSQENFPADHAILEDNRESLVSA